MSTNYKGYPSFGEDTEEWVCEVAKRCGTYPFLIRALLRRNPKITEADIFSMLKEPWSLIPTTKDGLLPDTDLAVKIIKDTLKSNKNIYVFADYDCDGITSGYIAVKGLELIRDLVKSKSQVKITYPQRSDGYGISMKFCQEVILDKKAGLVVTVDNGITKQEEIAFLKQNKINAIVTDHHEPIEGLLPKCVIVNPCFNERRRDYLAGCAVIFEVIKGLLLDTVKDQGKIKNFYCGFLPIVMLGTVGDMMPLSPENIAIINLGLALLNQRKAHPFLNLLADISAKKNIVSRDLSFDIVPMINAAGRMGNVLAAAAGFFTGDPDKQNKFADVLTQLNLERKKVTASAKKEIEEISFCPEDRIITFNGSKYQIGIIGILAGEISSLQSNYLGFAYRDSGDGILRGSMRCGNPEIDNISLLQGQQQLGNILSFAGHNNAGVINLKKEKLQDFIKGFSENYDKKYPEVKDVEQTVYYDDVISLASIDTAMLNEINKIPFDTNSQPVFLIPFVHIDKVTESKNKPENLKFSFSDNTATKNIWAWKYGSKYTATGKPKDVHIICQIVQDFMSKNEVRATANIKALIPANKET